MFFVYYYRMLNSEILLLSLNHSENDTTRNNLGSLLRHLQLLKIGRKHILHPPASKMILPTSYTYKLNADLTDVLQIKLT